MITLEQNYYDLHFFLIISGQCSSIHKWQDDTEDAEELQKNTVFLMADDFSGIPPSLESVCLKFRARFGTKLELNKKAFCWLQICKVQRYQKGNCL